VTANHFWLDGIVSGLLVALALAVQRLIRTARRRGPDRDPGAGDLTDPVHGQLPVGS